MSQIVSDTIPASALQRRAVILGIITAACPIGLNMYVPALPMVAADLRADPSAIQLSLTSFLIALAVGQNVYGPASDRVGRRLPLLFGMGLFVLGACGAALCSGVEALVAWRFVQGFGACAAFAIPRAIIRDLHSGAEAARIMAMVVLVVAVAPLLAPLAGSILAELFSWRYIFWAMASFGLLAIAAITAFLPESLSRNERSEVHFAAAYSTLLKDGHFICVIMMLAFGNGSYFAFLAGSPFVFMTLHGWTAWEYSLVFALAAVSWAGAAQFAAPAMTRFGAARLMIACPLINTASMTVLLVFSMLGSAGPFVVIGCMLILYASTGILFPVGTVAALQPHPKLAGTASALLGTTAFGVGAASSALVAALADGSEKPMIGVLLLMVVLALASGTCALRFHRAPPPLPDRAELL
jgi:MFS transporter, DHA1 family, multidrug resistance protein